MGPEGTLGQGRPQGWAQRPQVGTAGGGDRERPLGHLGLQLLARPERARKTTRWRHRALHGISADVQVRDL